MKTLMKVFIDSVKIYLSYSIASTKMMLREALCFHDAGNYVKEEDSAVTEGKLPLI